MKPFRKHVAIAIDGGGIKGIIPAQALVLLEQRLGKKCPEIFQLAAGTSTGSIISAGIANGMTAAQILDSYLQMGESVLRKTLRSFLWPLTRYKYSGQPLAVTLQSFLRDKTMGDFWKGANKIDLVITVRDLAENRTRFIKPWKEEYKNWLAWKAVLASCSVPTYFPVVEGRYVDGGVGSYSNPCYLAAYEAAFCLRWDPRETTILSLGTGRSATAIRPFQPDRFFAWNWIGPMLDTFLSDASDQQVRLVRHFFKEMDFRRFQVDTGSIDMDDTSKVEQLMEFGWKMGEMILGGEQDEKAVRPAGKAVMGA